MTDPRPTTPLNGNLMAADYCERLRAAVSWTWRVLAQKIAHGQAHVNREASLQLHYAACLQQVLPLLSFSSAETATIELESAVRIGKQPFSIDVLVTGSLAGKANCRIAIEMKCYRVLAASGGKRGATDIFMKDVYEDLAVLERYCAAGVADVGVALVMNEHRGFVHPAAKTAKCWAYDISHGSRVGPSALTVPIGGRQVDIKLQKSYQFNWEALGDFFFMEVEGHAPTDTRKLARVR